MCHKDRNLSLGLCDTHVAILKSKLFLKEETTALEREKTFTDMMKIALEIA